MDWATEIGAEFLGKVLSYDCDTGKLYWKKRWPELFRDGKQTKEHQCKKWNANYAGKEAGSKAEGGYLVVSIRDKLYKAHRVAWAIHHNRWPQKHLDHINGDTSDNRLANLREVTPAQNMKNCKMQSNNTSGVRGVSWHSKQQAWVAIIEADNRRIRLGSFKSLNEAKMARKQAEASYGFHANHGRANAIEKGTG